MATSVYQVITDRIIATIQETGALPWRCPWVQDTPKSLASGKPYRGVNIFLLGAQRFASPYWTTYKQAAERGGNVRKGEKASPCLFSGYFAKGEKGKLRPADKADKAAFYVVKYYSVFNATQCDGLDVPTSAVKAHFDPIEACERIVSGYPDAPPIEHGGNMACYIPSQDTIGMPRREAFRSPEEYYSTLFHEMAHSTGAEKRLARKGVVDATRFGSHAYSFEELVAECGSAFMCGEAGILNSTVDNSTAYIASWVKKLSSEPKWIVDASQQAAKAADLILDKRARAEVKEAA